MVSDLSLFLWRCLWSNVQQLAWVREDKKQMAQAASQQTAVAHQAPSQRLAQKPAPDNQEDKEVPCFFCHGHGETLERVEHIVNSKRIVLNPHIRCFYCNGSGRQPKTHPLIIEKGTLCS